MTQNAQQPIWPDTFDDRNALKDVALEQKIIGEAIESGIDAQGFCDYYTAVGWRKGSTPITDWRAAVRTWEKRGKDGWY